MKPDRKIPHHTHTLESHHMHHFATLSRIDLPYRERFQIIVRRFRYYSRTLHNGFIIDIRRLIPQQE